MDHSIRPVPVNPGAGPACKALGSSTSPMDPGPRSTPTDSGSRPVTMISGSRLTQYQASLHGSRLHTCSCGPWYQASPQRLRTRPIPVDPGIRPIPMPNWPEDSGSKPTPAPGWPPQTQVPRPSLQTQSPSLTLWTPATRPVPWTQHPSPHLWTSLQAHPSILMFQVHP